MKLSDRRDNSRRVFQEQSEQFLVEVLEPLSQAIKITGVNSEREKRSSTFEQEELKMNSIIYIVGFVVVVMFVLSMLGLR